MDFVKSFGGGVKAVADYTIRGRGVVYGGEDLTGDTFTKDTDFGDTRPFIGMPVYYDHSLGSMRGQIGTVKAWMPTDDGIDVEIELDRRNKYVGDVMKLVKSGALGLSTGALSHLVVRDGGEVKRWVVGEISLTPTPAEPRTLSAVKRHQDTVSSDAGTTSGDDHTSASQQGTEPTMSDIKDAVKAAINELAGEPVNGGTFVPAPQPTVKSIAVDNDEDPFASRDYERAYKSLIRGTATDDSMRILRNASAVAFKTMTEGTNNNGGFTVPTTVNRDIVARRDDMSLLGQFAFTRVTTESWKHIMPAQSTKATPGIVGEGVTATASEPNFANSKTIQLYKDTLEFALSDELLSDTSSNLEQFLQVEIARAMAVSANSYIILGTGSSQPFGLVTRVTNSVALSATAYTNAQVVALSTAVNGNYLQNGETGWIMRNATWGAIRTLDLTNYHPLTMIENGVRKIEGWNVALSESVAAARALRPSVRPTSRATSGTSPTTPSVSAPAACRLTAGVTYAQASRTSWRHGATVAT